MRNLIRGAAALLLAAGTSALAAPPTAPAMRTLSGEYVEARTCNVYTGACHANGEHVTAGREAMLAWHVTTGASGSVKLDGLNAVAVVAGSQNLADKECVRESVLYVDSRATNAQRAALAEALAGKYGAALGKIT